MRKRLGRPRSVGARSGIHLRERIAPAGKRSNGRFVGQKTAHLHRQIPFQPVSASLRAIQSSSTGAVPGISGQLLPVGWRHFAEFGIHFFEVVRVADQAHFQAGFMVG